MSEPMQPIPGGSFSAEAAAAPELSAGTLLRQAREAAGLHIAVLAVSLKVPVRKLEALEADQWGELPDAVFARALAATVCRMLKIDPAPVLARLPQSTAPRLTPDDETINAPFHAPGENLRSGFWDQLSRPVVMAVLALLLGALVLILLPSFTREASVADAAPVTAAPVPVVAAAAVPGPAADKVADPPVTTTAAPLLTSAPETGAAPTTAPPQPAVAAAAPTPVDGAPGAVLVFNARAASWVQVIDAKGKVALRKTLAPAEVSEVSGALPLSVVVGRADAIQVQVRGKPLDLASSTKNNVARFEVK
ncbi:helix-turn-helix domain-containing protein [Rhodoferax sediminis]|uniref:Helix-turn-helix domain-containing protein n=2 Tax=Rhodoferax sediminis TaxID=2509614 RepID=A0A515DBL2_9BURK|nr:helix-turn-helix domain-containing protein [Rhodoferax sediminis]